MGVSASPHDGIAGCCTVAQNAHEMILEMVAWRDPNVVPIRAFYGEDLKVNFCGKLAADPHVKVSP
jgi:hypothetical protein